MTQEGPRRAKRERKDNEARASEAGGRKESEKITRAVQAKQAAEKKAKRQSKQQRAKQSREQNRAEQSRRANREQIERREQKKGAKHKKSNRKAKARTKHEKQQNKSKRRLKTAKRKRKSTNSSGAFRSLAAQVFDQIFGQVFDQGLWIQKIQCTGLLGRKNTVYRPTGMEKYSVITEKWGVMNWSLSVP